MTADIAKRLFATGKKICDTIMIIGVILQEV